MKKLFLIFVFLISVISCESDDDTISLDEIIKLEILDIENNVITESIGDGETLVVLKATIPSNHSSEFNQVTFNKSDGEFLGIEGSQTSRPVDENGNAFIYVKVPNVVEQLFFSAQITANNINYTSEKNISLKRANPDYIIIEPNSVSIAIGNSVTINSYLLRNIGKVSEDTMAEFFAFQLVNGEETEVGRFTGLTNRTDLDGKIIVTFHSDTGDIDTAQPVIIQVKSKNDLGETIEETVAITII